MDGILDGSKLTNDMNSHALNSLIRAILTAIAGALGISAWSKNDVINAIVSAVILGVSQWWSSKDRTNLVEKTKADTQRLVQ